MTSRIAVIAVDCHDARLLADFWTEVLGWEVWGSDPNGDIGIRSPDGTGPTIDFLVVPEGKTVKNRLHLDLRAADGDQSAEIARLEALGARRIDVGQGLSVSWVVLADPEGNEFCVLAD